MTARKGYQDARSQIVGGEVVRRAKVGRPNEPRSVMLNALRMRKADHFLILLGGFHLAWMSVLLPFESLRYGRQIFQTFGMRLTDGDLQACLTICPFFGCEA